MPDYYGDNIVLNPDAEGGNTTSWSVSSASAVATGHDDSSYCFQVDEGGSMEQSIAPPSGLEDLRLTVYFLPELPQEEAATREAKMEIICTLIYSDSSKDIITALCEVAE